MKKTNTIKWLAITITTLIYLSFSLKIGFLLTGDMHSGGPLIGLFFTPFIALTMTLILFFNQRKIREKTIISLTTFLSFFLYALIFNSMVNSLFLKIYKEHYLFSEHMILINSTKLILIALTTSATYFLSRRIITIKKTTP